MKWAEFAHKPEAELVRDLSEARSRMVDMRFKAHAGSLKHVRKIREAKKDISRILTRLSQLVHTGGSSGTRGESKE